MKDRVYKIGTRDSQLAVWQAEKIQKELELLGITTELVYIKSLGELDLISPLYEMGVQGIFTKTLDIALLNGQIDIAVHSLKDVPTQLPKGLSLAAIPKRGNHKDVLITRNSDDLPDNKTSYTLATSSLRRKAQWLNRYPTHQTDSLRGNINTRLEKLQQTASWGGALFAAAGIERINLQVPHQVELDWMLPAPAQGALGVVCRESDETIRHFCQQLNDEVTQLCVTAERNFLRALMGGCTMPIAAYAYIENNLLHFKGNVLTIDGKEKKEISTTFNPNEYAAAGRHAAQALMDSGAQSIINTFRNLTPDNKA
jgi:hydroxymethylbilane synthase